MSANEAKAMLFRVASLSLVGSIAAVALALWVM